MCRYRRRRRRILRTLRQSRLTTRIRKTLTFRRRRRLRIRKKSMRRRRRRRRRFTLLSRSRTIRKRKASATSNLRRSLTRLKYHYGRVHKKSRAGLRKKARKAGGAGRLTSVLLAHGPYHSSQLNLRLIYPGRLLMRTL